MKAKLLGFRKMDFKPKDGGNQVKGTKLYISYLEDDVTGQMCDDLFIRNDEVITVNLKDFINKDIVLDLGIKGKVQCVSAV